MFGERLFTEAQKLFNGVKSKALGLPEGWVIGDFGIAQEDQLLCVNAWRVKGAGAEPGTLHVNYFKEDGTEFDSLRRRYQVEASNAKHISEESARELGIKA